MTRLGQLCFTFFLIMAGCFLIFGLGLFDKAVEKPVPLVQSFDAAVTALCGDTEKSSFMIYFSRDPMHSSEEKSLSYFYGSRAARYTAVVEVNLDALDEVAKSTPPLVVAGPLTWDKDKPQVRNLSVISTRAFPLLSIDHADILKSVKRATELGTRSSTLVDCREAIQFAWPK